MAEIAYALYASPAYMDGRRAADFERDTFVGFDDSLAGTQQERWLARQSLLPGVPFKNELWLLVHGELRHAPRVRAVIEWVDDVLVRAAKRLAGVAGTEG